MSEQPRDDAPGAAQPAAAETPQGPARRRIGLDLLDEYSEGIEARGYDPYNAYVRGRVKDAWKDKPKRS